jgi:hypothetical protein
MSKLLPLALLPLVLSLAAPLGAADAPKADDPSVSVPPNPTDDSQDRLAIALRSYYLLQQENAQLKATIDGQVSGLRAQLRQALDQINELSTENAALRTRLALAGAPPSGQLAAPTRPAQH